MSSTTFVCPCKHSTSSPSTRQPLFGATMSSKRGSVFDQGRPENPFPERDQVEPVRKATAAQMATRKIKAAKGRRTPGVSSGLSQSMMQPSQPSGFGFGGGDNNDDNNNNSGASSFGFGSQQAQSGQGTSMFGGGATNSFPPTQSSAPSNSFSNSSFPAFGGGNNVNAAFSPQPPSAGFSFTAGSSNPFAASAPPTATNGSSSGGFSGSIFNTGAQSTSTPFAGFGGNNNTSSAASSNSMFGTSAPQTNMFGNTMSSAENSASTTLAAPANPFGGLSATTPSAPATPFNFGSTQPASTPTQDSNSASKSLFGSVQPASTASHEATPASKPAPFGTSFTPAPISSNSGAPSTPFSIFGAKTPSESISTPAASTNLFSNFGATSQSGSANTPAATPSLFPAMKQEGGSNGSLAGSNLFGGFGNSQGATASTPASTSSLFGTVSKGDISSTPAAGPTATPTPITSQSETTTTSTPAPSLFKSFGPTSTTSSEPDTSGANLFSASTPGNVFGGFNKTPATTTSSAPNETSSGQEASTPTFGINKTTFPANTSGSGSGLFSQSHQPKAPESTSFAFQQPSTSKTPSLFSQSQPANSKESNSPASFSPFNKPTSSSSQPASQQDALINKFGAPSSTEQPSAPPSKIPNLTEAAAPPPPEIASMPEKPRIGTIHLPTVWGTTDGSDDTLKGLAIQIATLNHHYRERLSNLPLTANWSALSRFHLKATEEISAKIAAFRKREAAAKGITGHESSLSVKRKATTEEGHDNLEQDATPSKKPRAAEAPSTPTPKGPALPTTTPKASPPVSNTSSLFGSVLSKSADSTAANAEKSSETSQSATSQAGFSFLSNGAKPAASSSPFQMPSSGSTGKSSIFGSSGGGLLGQFSSKAKSYEQLVAERKAKEKEEDYDSDEESEEQWSARWDKKEAERVAKEKENSAPSVQTSTAPTSSNSSGLNLLASFSKPTSGASTPGLFGSRTGSPAPSTGGKSVFDTPEAARSPASNPFAHLSSEQSSNSQDDDEDEDADDQGVNGQSTVSAQPLPRKRKVFDDSESESGEFAEDSSKRGKVDTAKKPTLADRITKDASVAKDDDSEKENGDPNGTQTPSKPFSFFDFGKAAQSAPPKSDKFAGDQTFKIGTPIKFGSSVKDAPTFQFQPATPAPGDLSATPSKPPPASTFSFLNAGSSSTPGSVFSSRAATPMSEAEASGKESAADNDDDDGEKHAQVDLSDLTEEEKAENAVLFHTEQALCKHQVDKEWANYARGRLWILKNNKTGKAIVRMRLSSGNTMLNYNIFPKLKTSITGKTKKMVTAIGTKKDGKTGNLIFAVKNEDIAAEFSNVYNENTV
ncbi:unnamed protein product [Periconia digitata]|uniref:Nuclear pore complex NUP2/50/61 domain-containing protein n=1 Tax=Periconia digitata TaxID=1303443 RepID=A0A9W4UNN2_9PLEO|nr:unnamed protein product [Periconia digitata]